MNKEEIIKLAQEAGLIRTGDGWTEPHRWGMAEIERFADLVAAAERKTPPPDNWAHPINNIAP